jgi:hypothetical protein
MVAFTYYIRFFDAHGELLGFHLVACPDDASAMREATANPLPEECVTVEVARESRFVWRGKAAEIGLSVH